MRRKGRQLISLILISRFLRKRRNRRQRQRRTWCRQWIANHDRQGAYCNLVKELHDGDSTSFTNFLRVPKHLFEDLVSRIYDRLQHRDTNLRPAISVQERLALTLRFLATGTL